MNHLFTPNSDMLLALWSWYTIGSQSGQVLGPQDTCLQVLSCLVLLGQCFNVRQKEYFVSVFRNISGGHVRDERYISKKKLYAADKIHAVLMNLPGFEPCCC